MKKLAILLLSAITIFNARAQEKEIIIKLQTVQGDGVFMPGTKSISPSNDAIQYKGVPNTLTEYVVRSMCYQDDLNYWNLYKKGKIDKERFLEVSAWLNIDTTKLTEAPVDYQVIILIGTNQNGKRVIIIDSNNDEDFSNEKILEFDYPLSIEKQKEIENSMQTVLVNYEYYYEGKIINKQVRLKPSPYMGNFNTSGGNFSELEKKYDLVVSDPEYRKGEIELNKTNYEVFATNRFTGHPYSNQKRHPYSNQGTAIFFSDKSGKQPSEVNGDIAYQIGDVVNSKGQYYLIESISLWGDIIRLKSIGKN